ncbi:dihydropteroate synthase-like protein, partial [Methanophagales archaeon]
MVRDAVKNADVDGGSASALQLQCEVLTQDLDIAAFTTPASLRRALATQRGNGNKYDLILVSGLCKADFSRLERELKTPVRLGPRNAYDIAETLKFADRIEFSARTPADVLLRMKRKEDAKQLLQVLEVRAKDKFSLKGVKIGGNARMKVCAELVDATLMDNAEIQHRMEY